MLTTRPAPSLVASMRSSKSAAPARSKAPLPACSRPATVAGPVPKKMQRAKAWTSEVENVFRLQEAGYRDMHELRAFVQLVEWRLCFVAAARPPRTGAGAGVTRAQEQSRTRSAQIALGCGVAARPIVHCAPPTRLQAGPARAGGLAFVALDQETSDEAQLGRRAVAALLPREAGVRPQGHSQGQALLVLVNYSRISRVLLVLNDTRVDRGKCSLIIPLLSFHAPSPCPPPQQLKPSEAELRAECAGVRAQCWCPQGRRLPSPSGVRGLLFVSSVQP